MSSSDLKAQGVLGLDDSFASADSDNCSEYRSPGAVTETETSECVPGNKGKLLETELTLPVAPQCSRGELLKELRGLHVLDELIMEENMKIHALRRAEKESLDKIPPQSAGSQCMNKERQAFLLELEREKMEVERMEKHLDKECNFKRQLSRTRKVVKCSVMERASVLNLEDSALCDELLSDYRRQHHGVKHLPALPQDPTTIDSKESCNTATFSAKMSVSQEFVQGVNGQPPHANTSVLGCGDAMEGSTSSNNDFTEPAVPQLFLVPPEISHDHSELIDKVVIQHFEDTEKGSDLMSVEIVRSCSEEAALTPEICSEHGAFDPGGNSNDYPVPAPRKLSLAVNDNGHLSTLCPGPVSDPVLVSQEPNITPKPKETSLKPTALLFSPVPRPDVKEHSVNSNKLPLVDLEQSSRNDSLGAYEQSTLDCCSLESTVTPVDTDVVQMEMQLCQKSVLTADSGSNEELRCSSAHLPTGSHEPSGTDDQKGVEISNGFQRCGTARRSPVNQPNLCLTTRDMTNFKTPIVLDTGSGLMKAGFANQDLPNTIFPNIIGLPKYEEIMNGKLERETYIGHEAQHMRGVLTLKYPMQNGIIRNWDEMEKIWHHTFQQLHVDPEDHPVLLTEAAMNPHENRQRMVELMFECFNVPLTYVAMQAVLALYAAGRTTGVVFDSGDGVSHSVPVFEGYCLPHAVQRFTLAGHDVTVQLKKLLQEQGVCMRTSAEMEIVREMKEKCCRVSQGYESELACGSSASSETHYTMPDGQVVQLGTEKFRAPEILFKPELIGRDHYGMHESIFKSILRSDIDLRRSFLGNIVLSGGNTLLAGLPERLQSEIRTMVPMDLAECVRVTSPKDRDFSVWCGGAVLANLTSFESAWISQEEYEEYGPQIVFRKCF